MKKAPIAVALVLVFGLFAAAFSLAPAIAQNATSNATRAGNVTSGTTGGNVIGGNQTSGNPISGFLGNVTQGIKNLTGGGI